MSHQKNQIPLNENRIHNNQSTLHCATMTSLSVSFIPFLLSQYSASLTLYPIYEITKSPKRDDFKGVKIYNGVVN